MNLKRLIASAGLAVVSTATLPQCSAPPEAPPTAPPAASAQETFIPVLSVRELMAHIIDPTADAIFDAAVVDVSASGTVATMPVTAEDWLIVERGALTLAEASNLLKMPRPVVPPGTPADVWEPGTPAPELPPAEIQIKIDQDRARWNRHADELRTAALASLETVRARDIDALFRAGTDIDNACESCHLEYWYPGDRPAVLRNQNSTVTFTPPKK